MNVATQNNGIPTSRIEYLVDLDLKGQITDEQREILESQQNIKIWRQILSEKLAKAQGLMKQIDADILEYRAKSGHLDDIGWVEFSRYQSERQTKKKRVSGFASKLQAKLAYTKRLIAQHQQSAQKQSFAQDPHWRQYAGKLAHICTIIRQREIAKDSGNDWELVKIIQATFDEHTRWLQEKESEAA